LHEFELLLVLADVSKEFSPKIEHGGEHAAGNDSALDLDESRRLLEAIV